MCVCLCVCERGVCVCVCVCVSCFLCVCVGGCPHTLTYGANPPVVVTDMTQTSTHFHFLERLSDARLWTIVFQLCHAVLWTSLQLQCAISSKTVSIHRHFSSFAAIKKLNGSPATQSVYVSKCCYF